MSTDERTNVTHLHDIIARSVAKGKGGEPDSPNRLTLAREQGRTIWVVRTGEDNTAMRDRLRVPVIVAVHPHAVAALLRGAKVRVVVNEGEDSWAAKAAADLTDVAKRITLVRPAKGCRTAAEHVEHGHGVSDFAPIDTPCLTPEVGAQAGLSGRVSRPGTSEQPDTARRIILTPASQITARPVRWLWEQRLPRGELALLAGRESVGKSTVAYTLVADISRGTMPGVHHGTPMTVLVCATEDSWEHTIVPRLHGAHADLTMVQRVEVADDDTPDDLTLPRDLLRLEATALEQDAALLLLDPLMSRLGKQDTHRDNEVRQALEPLVRIAHRTGMSVLGIIHHRKASSTNALDIIMASKAFTAVARSVHTVVYDPDDDGGSRRLLGTAKNNLGRADLPILTFTITEHRMPTPEGDAVTSKLVWGEAISGSIDEMVQRADEDPDTRSIVADAADWLRSHLADLGGTDERKSILKAARSAGISESTLARARKRLRLTIGSFGFPRQTYWTLPGTAVPAQPGPRP